MLFLEHSTLFVKLFCVLISISSAKSDLSDATLTSTGEFILENGNTFYIGNVHREDEPQLKFSFDYHWQIKNVTKLNSTTRIFSLRSYFDETTNLKFSIFKLNKNVTEYYFEWVSPILNMCFHYGFNNANWYTGYQSYRPEWPLDTRNLIDMHYMSIKERYYSILEHLYINSDGFALLLNKFEMSRSKYNYEPMLCFSKTLSKFHLYTSSNIRAVTDFVVHHSGHIPKPTSVPDGKSFRFTNWYTGNQYLNQSIMKDLANKIVENGFANSTIVANSQWEKVQSDFENNFSNVDKIVRNYHQMEVELCLEVYPTLNSNTFFTQSYFTHNVLFGEYKMLIFSNAKASDWYSAKLKVLSYESGVDCFLINDYFRPFHVNNQYYNQYIETVANAVKATSWLAYRTQHLTIFLHLNFYLNLSYEEILKSIIPQSLSVSIAGYSYFAVPIGKPNQKISITEEMYIRTVQACALMPSIAFHQYPWKYSENAVQITKRYVELHREMVPHMLELAKKRVSDGSPIIRPMWYVAPDDPVTYKIDDQFMLGDDILVAPVVKMGQRSRSVYLPSGNWIDHLGQNFSGPEHWTLCAPLDTLLYFKRRIDKL